MLWALSSLNLTTERAPPISNSLHTIYHVFFMFLYLYIVLFASVDVLALNVILCCRYVLVAYIVGMY